MLIPICVLKRNSQMGKVSHGLFRAKGILWFNGSQLRHIFQLSGPRYNMKSDNWSDFPCNQLIFTGRHLDTDKIR